MERTLDQFKQGPVATGLVHEAGILTAEDGTHLFCQGVLPEDTFRGAVALVHGYTSFSDWLLPLMTALARRGLACFAIDYRGHGLSEGVPRHVFSFQEYLTDVRTLCRHVAERADQRRLFLVGNSLGGLIVSHYAALYPDQVQGAVLTAPFFGPAFQVPGWLSLCAQVTSLCRPTCPIPRHHPDLPDRVTFRWWTETMRAQQWVRSNAARVTAPVMVLHGEQDQVASPQATADLFARLGSEDKILRLLPGLSHPDMDPCRNSGWWPEVGDWLVRRCGPSPARAASPVAPSSGREPAPAAVPALLPHSGPGGQCGAAAPAQ